MEQWERVSVTATQKQVSGASHSVQAEARSLYPGLVPGTSGLRWEQRAEPSA